MMTLLALGQIILDHPEKRPELLPAMNAAADRLVDLNTLAYATTAYGHHAVQLMGPGEGHAYAGYISMGLGMLRLVEPNNHHAQLHDKLDAELRSRLFGSPNGLFETFPGETSPPDIAVVAGSIGLHARATGMDVRRDIYPWSERFARCAIHPTGYLLQRVKSGTCHRMDAARGVGTALAAFALRFVQPALSFRLYQALADPKRGLVEFLGFAGIREYAKGFGGDGDDTAGPIVMGASVGASAFALGAARLHEDRELFRKLYRSTHLLGAPIHTAKGTSFAVGGALGNAVLLAMITAKVPHRPVDPAARWTDPAASPAEPAADGGAPEPAKGAP
jgi:hypothetical protein